MQETRTLDILIGKQLLRARMRVGQRLLCILRITKSAADLDHPKYGDPPLRHHLHDHQHRRDGKVTKHWVVDREKIHVSMPRMNPFAVPEGDIEQKLLRSSRSIPKPSIVADNLRS